MFEVVEAEEAKVIEQEARMRGMFKAMLTNLVTFHETWAQDKDNEGKPFMVWLNKSENDVFYGKKTDSLYTGIMYALKKAELQENWRLIKRDGFLIITPKQ